MTDALAPLPAYRRYLERALNGIHLPVTLYVLWIGTRTLLNPADSPIVEAAFPIWLTFLWAGTLTLGGLLIGFGTLVGWLRTEQTGHGFHLSGLVIYAGLAVAGGLFESTLLVVVLTLGGVSALRSRQIAQTREGQAVANDVLRNSQERF